MRKTYAEHAAEFMLEIKSGIPCKLNVTLDFGRWFSGIFDGEGCLLGWYSKGGRLHIKALISLRYDDKHVLDFIQENLGGSVTLCSRILPALPKYQWSFTGIKNLAETFVPLIDTYELKSKKGKEFVFWRQLVIQQYMASLGGRNPRLLFLNPHREEFMSEQKRLVEEIHRIRYPKIEEDMP